MLTETPQYQLLGSWEPFFSSLPLVLLPLQRHYRSKTLAVAVRELMYVNYYLFAISVNSEVSNEVEVTPGVHIRALRAAPVGPCYTNYLKWFQLLIRWSYKIIG